MAVLGISMRTDECPRVGVEGICVQIYIPMPYAVHLFSCLNECHPFFCCPCRLTFLLTWQVGVVDLRRGGFVLHLPHAVLLLQVAQGQGS